MNNTRIGSQPSKCSRSDVQGEISDAFRTDQPASGVWIVELNRRGQPGSEASAMIFGEFFPNPGGRPFTSKTLAMIGTGTAFYVEALGSAVLVLVILCTTDERNGSRPGPLTAATIGLTITMLISLLAPFTMAGFNPARDFAPRVFSTLVGWGRISFATNGSGWLTVYIVGPIEGGQFGGILYRLFFRRLYASSPAAS